MPVGPHHRCVLRAPLVGVGFVAAVLSLCCAGCGPGEVSKQATNDSSEQASTSTNKITPGKLTGGDAQGVEPAMAAAFRQAANWQATEVHGATVIVRRACEDVLPRDPGDRTTKWVGIDVEVESHNHKFEWLDLHKVAVLDGATEQRLADTPRLQRLTPDGIPAADDDPALASAGSMRYLLAYRVPAPCRTVLLRYRDELLVTRPVELTTASVRIPEPSLRTLAVMKLPVDDPSYDRYLLFVECWQWARSATPRNQLQLRLLSLENASLVEPSAVVEVDDRMRVVERLWADRPYYIPVRWFLVEFRYPKGSVAVDLAIAGEQYSLPSESELRLSPETLDALKPPTPTEPDRAGK